MKQPVLTIARFSLLEAIRGKILWVLVSLLVLGLLVALFVSQATLTETRETQVALMAGFLRLSAVLVMIFFVISSIARDFQDKSIELLFAIAMPRYQVFLGKFAGFSVLALFIAVIDALGLLLYAEPSVVLLWSITLWAELTIIALLSFIFILSLESVAISLMATIGAYALMRFMPAIQSMGDGPFQDSAVSQLINGIIDLISLLLPKLDQFAQSQWLVNGDIGVIGLVNVTIEFVLFIILFVMVGVIDLKRKAI